MEHAKRSIVKALSWRAIGFVTTIIAVYVYSKDVTAALVVGVVTDGVKMFLYYMHERVWNRINYGRKHAPDYEI